MPASASDDDINGDLFLEDDDPSALLASPAHEKPPWRILIVDDDVDVHVVTKFALSNTQFQGRRLSFLHAYSGKEALATLRATPDIALVLLDVIMETPDAGLQVARQVRSDLHNELVRIVLRTGQPGQALEHSIICDYDINDFWSKADLTTRKLFTTVIASLRAYAGLQAAAADRAALHIELAEARAVQELIGQQALVLTLDPQGRIRDASDRVCALSGKRRDELVGHGLDALHAAPFPEPLAGEIERALAHDGAWSGDIHTQAADGAALHLRCSVQALSEAGGAPYEYVAVATVLV
ncbi:PAS domain-containing protein [Massilia genomosp. 1]|uniref:PAS domain S-box protein n=1 Tax=Massilia genomosp. 1 TaxID=2609280 RepID=A0ABX0MUD6_9BURK|nr:PAS domain-containing protein [Massilia genomosp. 1]NHZ66345.1 PAS domain S-box protein [Massilia genomosp. 1]